MLYLSSGGILTSSKNRLASVGIHKPGYQIGLADSPGLSHRPPNLRSACRTSSAIQQPPPVHIPDRLPYRWDSWHL